MAAARPAPRTVRVVPDVVSLGRHFDYLVPRSLAGALRIGTEIRVPLHGRRVRGWVIELDPVSPPGVVLQPVLALRGEGPPAAVVELASWAAWRWAGSVVHFLRTASSGTVVRARQAPYPSPSSEETSSALGAELAVRPRARGLLRADSTSGASRASSPGAANARTGTPSAASGAFSSLVAQALAGGTTVLRVGPAAGVGELLRMIADRLLAPQALDHVSPSSGPGGPDAPGVLVVVPEARQIAPLASWLESLGVAVAVLPEHWEKAHRGGCVVVGTRAAAWAPLPSLVGAVVLDAHDRALVEQKAPTWSAPVVVAERARRDGAPCVLVSPCPTAALISMGAPVLASRSAERRGWPAVELVDRREEDPRHGLLSARVVALARWAGAVAGRRLLCIVNRTGGARLVLCGACGDIARCATCAAALELAGEGGSRRLRCRRCGSERPVVCARCGSTATRALRHGVSRLRGELEALASGPVAELTAHSDEVGDVAVVVGTDAALRRGIRADVVVLLDIDGELLAPRLGAAERALALVARACRAVRHSTWPPTGDRAPGHVVVQTRQPGHPVLRAAVAGDPTLAMEPELEMRRLLRLPPITALAQVSGPGAPVVAAAIAAVAPRGAGIEIDGPHDGIWSVRAPDHRGLCDLLARVPRPPDRVRIEVDPHEL